MKDNFNRQIGYLRISLTTACNLNCVYCGVGKDVAPALSDDQLVQLVTTAVGLGLTAVRLTGGEPLLRPGAVELIERLKAITGLRSLTMTTNGLLLEKMAPALKGAGLDGLNISLDSCNKGRYRLLTGGGSLNKALAGIRAACSCGLPVKLNAVALEGIKEDLPALLAFARENGLPLRFIELMPLGCNQRLKGPTGAEIRQYLEAGGYTLTPLRATYGLGPAVYYRLQETNQPLGFIEPMGNCFCSSCNRLRLTAQGQLRPCLYSNQGVDLLPYLHQGQPLREAFIKAIAMKPQQHYFQQEPGSFAMGKIGG